MRWYFAAALLSILTSSQLLVSSFFLWRECKSSSPLRMTTEWRTMRLFPIPSVIYLIHNNVPCYLNICGSINISDNGQSQNCGNWYLIKTVPEEEIVNLTMDGNCVISCWNNYQSGCRSTVETFPFSLWNHTICIIKVKGCGEASCDSLFSAPLQGYMLGLLSVRLSGLAGVYTEYLMKKNNDSLYWQNVQLYMFGSIFNMARLLLDDFRVGFEKGPWWQRLFGGYSITAWLVVLNLGSTGLLVSWLTKYADNIVKVYSTSMAMLLTMVLSIFLFNFKPSVQLFLVIVICMISLHMYFAPVHMLVGLPVTSKMPTDTLKEVAVQQTGES